MSYAGAVRVFPNSVKTMFGRFPMNAVMQAAREARRAADRAFAADLRTGEFGQEIIALVKRAGQASRARHASRPTVAPKVARGTPLDND